MRNPMLLCATALSFGFACSGANAFQTETFDAVFGAGSSSAQDHAAGGAADNIVIARRGGDRDRGRDRDRDDDHHSGHDDDDHSGRHGGRHGGHHNSDDDTSDNDASGSNRRRPRVPGGSGCDDAGDIAEHAGCS
ncbi:MAG: hypothetical protein WBC90_05700 [Albidovulum sp.]